MKILKDRVLVKPINTENKSKSGLFIPGKQRNRTAKVIEIGIEVKHIKVGNTITYEQNTGTSYKYKGEEHLFLREEFEVVAIL